MIGETHLSHQIKILTSSTLLISSNMQTGANPNQHQTHETKVLGPRLAQVMMSVAHLSHYAQINLIKTCPTHIKQHAHQ